MKKMRWTGMACFALAAAVCSAPHSDQGGGHDQSKKSADPFDGAYANTALDHAATGTGFDGNATVSASSTNKADGGVQTANGNKPSDQLGTSSA